MVNAISAALLALEEKSGWHEYLFMIINFLIYELNDNSGYLSRR